MLTAIQEPDGEVRKVPRPQWVNFNVKAFGEDAHLGRFRAGLSCQAVGQKIGVGKDVIARIENAERYPSIEVFYGLCVLFGLDAASYFETGLEAVV